jgi:hypothetical protein
LQTIETSRTKDKKDFIDMIGRLLLIKAKSKKKCQAFIKDEPWHFMVSIEN